MSAVDVVGIVDLLEETLRAELVPDPLQTVTQELYDPPADACPVLYVIPSRLPQRATTLSGGLGGMPYTGTLVVELHLWAWAGSVREASRRRLVCCQRIHDALRKYPALGQSTARRTVTQMNVTDTRFAYRPPGQGGGTGMFASAVVTLEIELYF